MQWDASCTIYKTMQRSWDWLLDKRHASFQKYSPHIQHSHDESIEKACLTEVGMYEELDGINIITDARHGWRKNAKDTSVVAIGKKAHQVVGCAHITKCEDPVTQRHEAIGTRIIYNELDASSIDVNVHVHHRNLAINKIVKDRPTTQNQNDTWHSIKSVKSALKKVTTGPQYTEGHTWSRQLE
jgi:hypothetical protein